MVVDFDHHHYTEVTFIDKIVNTDALKIAIKKIINITGYSEIFLRHIVLSKQAQRGGDHSFQSEGCTLAALIHWGS